MRDPFCGMLSVSARVPEILTRQNEAFLGERHLLDDVTVLQHEAHLLVQIRDTRCAN
jgi:hypothetical protein